MEKGILGIKKDPKNQMLFSFVVRNGEEWPASDSGDSDYSPAYKGIHVEKPPADAKKCTKNRKRSPKAKSTSEAKQYKRKKANVAFRGESCSSTAVDEYDERASQTDSEATVSDDLSAIYADRDMAASGDRSNPWGQAVPDLVLIKIFRYVVDTAGAIPFLPSALRVCKLWNKVAGDPSLWKKMDLSYGWVKARDNTLEHLCENWLSQLNEINLSNWKDMTFSGLKADGVSAKNLSQIISKCSANLRLLNLSDNSLKGFNAVLKTIATTCSCLEILDISNAVFSSDFVSIDIEKLQRGCPLLKVLRLTNSQFRVSYASAQEKASVAMYNLEL